MKNLSPFIYLAFVLFVSILMSFKASAREREHHFRKDRPRMKGNERSERAHRVETGRLSHAGNGCPEGTMQVVFAPDNLSFTVLFDQFIAEVHPGDTRRDLITCNALIPIQIPENMQMEITRVDFRGFVALPQSAHAALTSVFNFRDRRGERDRMNLRYRFEGPVMDDYEISTDVMRSSQDSELSPCGGAVQLRVKNQLKVVSRDRMEPAQVTLDSIDGASHAIYHVNWRSCRSRGRGR